MAIVTDAGAGEHFDALAFDALLDDHGTPALWRKARTCPCLDATSGQADINCALCRDYPGLLWDDGARITVLAPGRSRRDEYDLAGAALQGMVTLTFPSTLTPGHLDWIELCAAEMVVNNERHVRSALDPLGRSTERLRMPHALSVEFCEAIVGGVLQPYALVTDFTIDPDGAILWADDAGPPIGTAYTLRYTARPVYICWSPQSRDEHATKQPYRCLAQRLDFFRQPAVGE